MSPLISRVQCSKLKKYCQKNKTSLFLFKLTSVCFLAWTSVSSENLKVLKCLNKVLMLLTCAGKSMQKLLNKIYVHPTWNWVPIKSSWYKYVVMFFDIHALFWTECSFPPTICPLKKKQKSKTKCILKVCYQAPGDLNQGCMLQWFQEIFNNKG